MNMKLAGVAVALACAWPAAHAAIVTVSGSTNGAPTFARPVENFSELSAIGTAVRYNSWLFTVNVGGEYSFLTTADFDSLTFLYGPSFNPANAMVNGLTGNDDLVSSNTSGFAYQLTAGATYAYVTTGFANTDAGSFSTTIGGLGIATAVPEASTWLMTAFGLGLLGIARRRTAAVRQASGCPA